MTDLRIGISGWTYSPWRSLFYPPKLPQKRELEFASRQVNSIEINGSFYSLQSAKSYRAWHDQTPDGFVFSVKGGRYITHLKRLKEIEEPLANFFASGVLCLEEKLGPILWQFPPQFPFNRERFERFFDLLPRDTAEASRLAKKHSAWMKERASTEYGTRRPVRHAIEIRHPSFVTPEFIELLRERDLSLVFSDSPGDWPYLEDLTSSFVYIRLHGADQLYSGGYSDDALSEWARKIRSWKAGRDPRKSQTVGARAISRGEKDIYVYFDNDAKVRAPFDAMALRYTLTGQTPEHPFLWDEKSRLSVAQKSGNSQPTRLPKAA